MFKYRLFQLSKIKLFLTVFALFIIGASTQAQTALDFNGTSSYVEVPYAVANNPTQFTVELWVKVNNTSATHMAPLSSRNGTSPWSNISGYNFYVLPNTNTWFFTGGISGSWNELSGPAVVVGQWTHLAATHDGTTYLFYVNGALVDSLVAGFSPNTSRPLRIGAGATEGGSNYYFNGAVDEVKIWNYARTASEINNNKNVDLPVPQTGLESYYQFEDGVATNKTGNTNGTLINSPTTVTGVTTTDPTAPPSTISGSTVICTGDSTTLTATGGATNSNTVDVWYPDACGGEVFYEGWDTQSYSGLAHTTVNSNIDGILNVTSTSNNPQIEMFTIGSFDPSVYKYINFRYKVVSGTASSAELFFINSAVAVPTEAYHAATSLVSDNAWHIASIDMATNANWATGGNITGLRYDYATTDNVSMAIDFITLSATPILGTGASITVAPSADTTYFVNRKGPNTNTSCISQLVTVHAIPLPPVVSPLQIVCNSTVANLQGTVIGSETIEWYAASTGGSALASSAALIPDTTYYAQAVNTNGCKSERSAVHAITNNALNFDGVDDFVTFTNQAILPSATDFTIETWVKPDDSNFDGAYHALFGKQTGSSVTSRPPSLYIRSSDDFSAMVHLFVMEDNTLSDYSFETTSGYILKNVWSHVAIVKEGALFKLYINGVMVFTSPAPGAVNVPTTHNFGYVDNYYGGLLDDVRFWNVPRTASEIMTNMNRILVGDETGLRHYYTFNQGTAEGNNTAITTLLDKTLNANNGTLMNFTKTGSDSNFTTGYFAQITGNNSIGEGQTTQLSHDASGGSWTSSATANATVNSTGLVTGIAGGDAVITYTTCSGSTIFTVTVIPNNTVSSASIATQTLTVNTTLTNIVHTTTGAEGIVNSGVSGANGLPAGVSASWTNNSITISGTPTVPGTFDYSIQLTGGYGSINATGTIVIILPVTSLPASSISNTSFIANWNSVSGATGYKLDVATDVNFITFISGFNNLDVSNVDTFVVSGLELETTYYYRLRGYNTETGGNSNIITVKPLATMSDFNNFTKMYFDGSFSITDPISNSTGAFTYTSDNASVATISGNTVTIIGAGTANITATQALDAAYSEGNSIVSLAVSSVSVVDKYGRISTTSANYTNKYGAIGGADGIGFNGETVLAKSSSLEANGLTADTASTSAYAIKQDFPSSTDGVYWISNSNINDGTPFQIYADMTTDGGGWILLNVGAGNSQASEASSLTSADALGYLPRTTVIELANLSTDVQLRAGNSSSSYAHKTTSTDPLAIGALKSNANDINGASTWANGASSTFVVNSGTWQWAYCCPGSATGWPRMYHSNNYEYGVHWFADFGIGRRYAASRDAWFSTWIR